MMCLAFQYVDVRLEARDSGSPSLPLDIGIRSTSSINNILIGLPLSAAGDSAPTQYVWCQHDPLRVIGKHFA
jgi:hypothetical protein